MSNSKHTPGPWSIGDEYEGYTNIKAADQQSTVAKLILVDDVDCESRHNARLIAAAPEMLEALENQLRLLQAVERETGYVTLVTQQNLEKLIAKAKGGA